MSGPIAADRLKSFLERIERLLEERAGIQSDIKDIFSEAKGVGYDVKTMRRLIQIRAQDSAERAEQAALLDTYMHALGMDGGAGREPTEEELEERAGRIVAEVDRCMDLVVDGQLPKIEAIRATIGCSLGKASKIRGMVEDRISRWNDAKRENEIALREMTEDDLGDPLLLIDKPRAQFREKVRAIAASIKPTVLAEIVPPPVDDDLAIPAFLDRRPA